MYRPASDMVDSAMMKPIMTPHHQAAIWKNRSPVLSAKLMSGVMKAYIITNKPACHAFKQHITEATIQGGLQED